MPKDFIMRATAMKRMTKISSVILAVFILTQSANAGSQIGVASMVIWDCWTQGVVNGREGVPEHRVWTFISNTSSIIVNPNDITLGKLQQVIMWNDDNNKPQQKTVTGTATDWTIASGIDAAKEACSEIPLPIVGPY